MTVRMGKYIRRILAELTDTELADLKVEIDRKLTPE